MNEDLVKLLELQARDTVLLEADRGLDGVLAEIEALDRQLADAERALETGRRAVADAGRRRQDLEVKLENVRKLEERGRQRLEQVRAQKEFAAVMTELDLARSVLAKEEAEWVRSSDAIAGLEGALRDAEAMLEALRESQKLTRGEIDLRRAEAEGRRQVALAARDQAASEVNRTLRTRYERLRSVKSVASVVPLSGASCGACHTAVPLNRRSQIRAGALIDSCESCGVILYSPEALD